MGSPVTTPAAALAALALTGVLAACGGGDPDRSGAAATPAESAASSSAPESAPPGTESPEPPVSAPGLTAPAETAGDLDQDSVPAAPDLGRGWQQYVDPGQPEEGYVGNGSWVRAREVAEVVQGVIPLGCTRLDAPPALPVPEHALEATYRGPGGAPGVALTLDYDRTRDARALVAGFARIARSCPAPAERVRARDPLTVVITPVRVEEDRVLDRRRDYGEGSSPWLWSEAVVRNGSRVGLLILATDPAAPAPDLDRLGDRLRRSVGG